MLEGIDELEEHVLPKKLKEENIERAAEKKQRF